MRRAFRWLFDFAAAGSLLAFLAFAGLWVRSHWVEDLLVRVTPAGAGWALCSIGGRLEVEWCAGPATPRPQPWAYASSRPPGGFRLVSFFSGATVWSLPGLARSEGVTEPAWPPGTSWVRGPYWVVGLHAGWPMLVTAILPSAWAARWWIARRRGHVGHCYACGYDLRGSPGWPSGGFRGCPECGAERASSGAG